MDMYEGAKYRAATPVVIEDLLQGMNEWRNIQDIVRVTFKAFHDVLKAQGDAIRSLERALEKKASQRDVAAAVASKVSSQELAERLHALNSQIARKADASDVSKRALKAEIHHLVDEALGDTVATLHSKASARDVHDLLQPHADHVRDLAADVARAARSAEAARRNAEGCVTVREVQEALEGKMDCRAAEQALASKADTSTVTDAIAAKADMGYITAMESDLKAALSEQAGRLTAKADRAAVCGSQHDLSALRQRVDSASCAVDRLDARIANEEAARQEAVARKADTATVFRALDAKADRADVSSALATHADAAKSAAREDLTARIIALQDELCSKAASKDVCRMLDNKANTEDVNKVLTDVCRELESKATATALDGAVREQALLNAGLAANSNLGRWLWKSGKTKAGRAVPWNVQAMNGDPDNFCWEKDKASVTVVAGGLYEVSFAIFAKKKPTLQVLVNGEPILSAINNTSYVTHHTPGRLTSVSNHPAGNVTGLSCIDFLSLPPKAKVALTYSGDDRGEGFMSLKRL